MSDAALPSDVPADNLAKPDPAEVALPMQLYVCTTCRDRLGNPGCRPGARLYAALAAETRDPCIEIVPVECLSVCKMNVALSFAAEGKWTYVYGVESNADVTTILAGARLYAEAPAGLIPWGQRPDILKKGVVARIPPRASR